MPFDKLSPALHRPGDDLPGTESSRSELLIRPERSWPRRRLLLSTLPNPLLPGRECHVALTLTVYLYCTWRNPSDHLPIWLAWTTLLSQEMPFPRRRSHSTNPPAGPSLFLTLGRYLDWWFNTARDGPTGRAFGNFSRYTKFWKGIRCHTRKGLGFSNLTFFEFNSLDYIVFDVFGFLITSYPL